MKISKKQLLGGAIALIPTLFIFLLVWGLLEPYFLDKEEETAVIPNLPAAWEGQKIAQLSDFQVGMWWDNVKTVNESIKEAIEAQPAALLISGDFIYHASPNSEKEIAEVIRALKQIREAKIPVYAVLGNHDYAIKNKDTPPKTEVADRLEKSLEAAGVTVLRNEVVALELPGSENVPLYLVGIDSHWAKNDRVDAALAQIPDSQPRIALMHNPNSFKAFPANTAPFAVAGHTHAGQIRLPFLPRWSWLSLAKDDTVVADKWEYQYGAAGNKLYVNRGIGFSDVPLRINCPPELTIFTLRSS